MPLPHGVTCQSTETATVVRDLKETQNDATQAIQNSGRLACHGLIRITGLAAAMNCFPTTDPS
eukprot:7937168-Prorocentrum_lima.AAC.1